MPYQFISQQHQLDLLCDDLLTRDVIGIDTEFVRQRTYQPALGLIQINSGEAIYLIDPLEITSWAKLNQVLSSREIVKVIHSCSEDIEVFKTALGVRVEHFYDTQVAEGFISGKGAIGLGALVQQYKNIELDKGQARTDWLQRPLSEKQLNYAASDVEWLIDIYQQQLTLLGDNIDLVYQDVDVIVGKKFQPIQPEFAWRDVKSNWQLKPRELAILKELAQWRLEVALARDLAINFVVKERTIALVAERQPTNLNSMKNIPGIHPMEIRKHGTAMLACVERGKAVAINDCPSRIPRLSEMPKYKPLFAEMKSTLLDIANNNNVAIEILASKRQINQFIAYHWHLLPWSREIEPELSIGWRGEMANTALLALLSES